jgi:tRNA dimethylallyltransferase
LKPEILVIGGPTASGKNEVALSVASGLSSEVVNADSRQVYRELVIGTNQPSEEDKAKIPHHLFAFLEPRLSFSAADYEQHALAAVRDIQRRKNLPIIVGGTGFYIKALLRGSWQLPARDVELRERLKTIARDQGKDHLHSMLARIDPQSAAEIAPNDAYRVSRALEIYYQTGKKRSEFRQPRAERFSALKVFIDLDRSRLKENVEFRTEQLFERGWVEEVQSLMSRYPDFEEFPASRSLGYPEIIALFQSKLTLESCKQRIKQRTLQYAKRQLTWFRNQDGYIPVSSTDHLQKLVDSVLQ